MLSIFCMQAHNPEFSMYKSVEKKLLKTQSVTESRKFGKLVAASGFFIMIGGVMQGVASTQKAPKFDIVNYEDYTTKYNRWQKQQSNYKLGAGALYTVAGICLLFAGDDLLTAKISENKATTLKLKTSTSSVGLCLNFK